MVSLDGYGDRFPHELSGGERQRIALARALAPSPGLLLLDEPFASLDHNLRVALRRDVVDVLRRTETPAVFVTHDQAEALSLGDRVAVMRAGRIEQLGSPAEVFHEPASTFIAAFMGDASFLPVRHDDGVWSTDLGVLDSSGCGPGVTSMVRPDDVQFEGDPGGNATVTEVEYHGSGWLISVDLNGARVQVARSHLEPLAVGDQGALTMMPGHRQVVIPTEA